MNRPKLKIPLTRTEKILEFACVLFIAASVVFTIVNYGSLPQRIPTHFNLTGKVDGFGDKSSLFSMPCIMLALYALLTVLCRFPHIFNYAVEIKEENAAYQYKNARLMLAFIKAEIMLAFALIGIAQILSAEGKPNGLEFALVVLIPGVFFTLIFFVVRMVKRA